MFFLIYNILILKEYQSGNDSDNIYMPNRCIIEAYIVILSHMIALSLFSLSYKDIFSLCDYY